MKPPPDGGAPLVRPAVGADVPAIRDIYAHHVLEGLSTFEETAPDVAEMARRLDFITARGLPYLVAESAGAVRGFAYAAPYRSRPAYRFSVENSVYVAPDATRRGLGRLVLADLVGRCTALGYRQMVAVIGDSANAGSIGLHAAMGFRQVGVIRSPGFKLGRWVDTVIMQRALGEGDAMLPPL